MNVRHCLTGFAGQDARLSGAILAVAPGFEPGRELPPYTLSRRAPSSARASHRADCTEPTPRIPMRTGTTPSRKMGRRPGGVGTAARRAVTAGGGGVIRTREG